MIVKPAVIAKPAGACITYVSSLWAERGGQWLCLFSQETAVPAR